MFSEHLDMTEADVILRSVDGQQLRAHKSTLSLASPVFHDMFTLPQPPSPEPLSVPVVDMCETAKVLDAFLRCVYPVPKPIVKDLDLLEALVAAAKKYETQVVLQLVGTWLVVPETLKEDPLHVYTIACTSADLQEPARIAGKCMTYNMVAHPYWDNNPACLTTLDLRRLIVYLVAREKAAEIITEKPSSSMFYDIRCDCKTQTKTQLMKEIGQVILAAFLADPTLITERAVGLVYKQLGEIQSCRATKGCFLTARGEEYARELVSELEFMSDEKWLYE